MAYHKFSVIGKLVSDPRLNTFSNGGAVAHFGLPVNFTRPKKNQETGEWEGESFIINVDVFNKDNPNYKPADWVMQSLRKGSQVYVEGRLRTNEYTDKTGTKVKTVVLVADVIEFLDPRGDGGGMGGDVGMGAARAPSAPAPRRAPRPPRSAAALPTPRAPKWSLPRRVGAETMKSRSETNGSFTLPSGNPPLAA